MFQDKTLICKECGEEFVFTAGEQEFMRRRGLRMSPAAAVPAVRTERTLSAAPVRCMMLFALSAELLLRCLSSPKRIVRFTATNAIRLCEDNVQIK